MWCFIIFIYNNCQQHADTQYTDFNERLRDNSKTEISVGCPMWMINWENGTF